jgi:hypothetical protein
MYATTSLKSWEQGIRLMKSLPGWIFRGQEDASWRLSSKLEREAKRVGCPSNMLPLIEKGIIEDFQRRAHHYITSPPQYTEHIEWLSVLQHHGGPTRLLDFTRSFYVAAFFATESAEGDSTIWCFNHIRLCLTKMGSSEKDPGSMSTHELNDLAVKTAEMYMLDFNNPASGIISLEPQRLSERLAVQQGCFLFPCDVRETFERNIELGLMLPKKTLDSPSAYEAEELAEVAFRDYFIVKIVVPHALHRDICSDLLAMNITSATLFPGLDGFARSLWSNLRVIEGWEHFRSGDAGV